MYITPLNFNQVLDKFYHQNKYDLMLLFVSSFDGNDKEIIREIINNANRIDRITGKRICFFYFVKETCDGMNEKLVRWVKDISDREPLYGKGVSVTMETADDICRHFGIMRSYLPAFILVNKDRQDEPHIFSIHDYQDFESFLTPLNILHSYIEDRESILSRYESEKRHIIAKYESKRKRTVVTQYDVDKRRQERLSWKMEIDRLYNRRDIELSRGEIERAQKREVEIEKYKKKLEDYPEVVICGEDESVLYPQIELDNLIFPQGELDSIYSLAVEKLNIALNSHDGNTFISLLQNSLGYTDAVLKVWQLVRTRGVRLSRILENIRYKIHERGFDVFISSKSQDYGLAHELYDFLVLNGFKPFLADSSIKEVGIDQYTVLIGEVINVCQYMVVFATDACYLETPYVAAEWHAFINDINTGYKPNAKIVSILSPNISPHDLPSWLRDKQCFTTDNYKDDLIPFLSDCDNEIIERLFAEIDSSYYRIKKETDRLLRQRGGSGVENMVNRFMNVVENERYDILSRLDCFRTPNKGYYDMYGLKLNELGLKTRHVCEEWDERFRQLVRDVEQFTGIDEEA